MPPEPANRRSLDVNLRSGPQMREYAAIVDKIARDRPGRVLDWGCGFGQVTRLLIEQGISTTAFDYREGVTEPVTLPLERFPEIDATVSAQPFELPFEDDSFDAALSCGALEHVHDPDASLEELKRVLVPGGTLYVYKLPNRFSYLEWIAKRLGLYYHGACPNDIVYSKRSAHDLLQRHGYEVRELRRANMLPLMLPGPIGRILTAPLWTANRALSRIPGLNLLATNLELIASAPR